MALNSCLLDSAVTLPLLIQFPLQILFEDISFHSEGNKSKITASISATGLHILLFVTKSLHL